MQSCQIHKIHEWIKCENDALKSDKNGFCLLHSRMANKDIKLFNDAINTKLLYEDYDFTGVFFPNVINFSGIEFKKTADFRGAVFSGPVNFIKVNFNDEAIFNGSIFLEEADFNRATFSAIANFTAVTFKKKIYFVASIFKGIAYFDNAKFYGEGNFSLASYSSQLYCSRIEIYEKVIFQSVNLPDKNRRRDSFRADFTFLDINSNRLIIFQDLSLAKAEFFGTDMRHVEFRNVEWYNLHGRKTVFDEVLLNEREINIFSRIIRSIRKRPTGPTEEHYSRVEVLYRYLKLNYEKEGDLKQAGDFHYGEMGMHRKANFWRRRIPISWYNFYWALSGYGERPLRALGWLAVFLVLLPLAIWLLGLDMPSQGDAPGFWGSFSFMFEKATLQRPALLSGINSFGRFISNLGLLIIPGQAALFLLALRNRLGRRR